MERFPLRRSGWAAPLIVPFAPGRHEAVIDGDEVRVAIGWLGSATIPLDRIGAVGRMRWPWWGGVGVRIARSTVAFVEASGTAVALELTEALAVRAPLKWRARRIVIAVEDVDGFIERLAAARGRARSPEASDS
ncbi:MAG: hypothetical protein QOD86_3134 [Miltoncostaeaceae bacterium]|nr:hypothetical protein [Miltoncostaeaceae bacterium]